MIKIYYHYQSSITIWNDMDSHYKLFSLTTFTHLVPNRVLIRSTLVRVGDKETWQWRQEQNHLQQSNCKPSTSHRLLLESSVNQNRIQNPWITKFIKTNYFDYLDTARATTNEISADDLHCNNISNVFCWRSWSRKMFRTMIMVIKIHKSIYSHIKLLGYW